MQTVSKTVPKSQLVSRRSGMIWIQISRKRIAEWFLTLQKQLKMAWKELLYCLMTQTLLCWCYITWISFFPLGLKELWLRYGTGAKQRFIPIHTLCIKIGNIQYSLLKAHILTGCDVMSKVGTKLAAVNSIKKGNALTKFGGEFFDSRKSAEVFLVNVLSISSKCETFDELRYEMYYEKKKSLSELPPSSNMVHGHIRRSEYVYHLSNTLLNFDEFILNYLDYGWEEKDSVIYPERCNQPIPNDFLKVCACKKGCKGRCGCKKFDPWSTVPRVCSEFCSCKCYDMWDSF